MYLSPVEPLPAVRARVAAAEPELEKRQLLPIGPILSSLLGGDEPTTTSRSRTVTVTTTRSQNGNTPTTTVNTRTTTNPNLNTRTTNSQASQATGPPPTFTTRTLTSQALTGTGVPDSSTSGQTQKKGLPAVVIGIIVAAAVIFGLIFVALLARKFFQRRRRNKRTTWGGSMITPFEPSLATKQLPAAPIATSFATTNLNNTNNAGGSDSRYPGYTAPKPPQPPKPYPAYPPATMSYNSQSNANVYSPAAPSSGGYAPYPFSGAGFTEIKPSAAPTARAPAPSNAPLSVVKRTFVPSLPDELSISNGETVRVLSVYDDGWALCEKVIGGEKGVVPSECLEPIKSAGSSNTPGGQLGATDKSVKRNSSLRRDANAY